MDIFYYTGNVIIKKYLFVILSFFGLSSFSQSKLSSTLKIEIVEVPKKYAGNTLYVAGNFNGWNAHDTKTAMLPKQDGSYEIVLSVKNNDIVEWKITRGSWDNVEVDSNGKDVQNHITTIDGPSIQNIKIEGWKDDFAPNDKQHTASPQVQIIDTAFYLKALGKTRRIWIYLPKDYSSSNKRYPVIYMHDGQNLFDAFTSAYGEWGVDEIMDDLFDKTKKGIIIVGIDNSAERMQEYNPYDEKNAGKKDGKKYVKSLVKSLKPFVDKHFRTLADAKNTSIAGSSMGGIISLWAVMRYPETFGSAGIFSPAFWAAPQFQNDVMKMMKNYKGKLFFYAGGMEGKTVISDMDSIINKINVVSKALIVRKILPDERHTESAWSKAFPDFIKMFFE